MKYSGFWVRVGASLIDSVLLWIPSIAFAFIPSLFGMIVANVVFQWLYFSLMESSSYQATLGKKALDLKVTDLNGKRISFGRATGRYFAKIISSLILGIGYLMVIWTEKKQGLHDKLADTLVLEK